MNMVQFRGTEYHHTHPSCLTDNLYLSAARAITSAVLLELGITSLINATLEMPSMAYQKQECIQIAVEDRICSKLYVYFDLVADKIHSVHLSGGKILVYCRAGMSRSATLCIAYFIKYHDMNVSEAFEFVKERRPIIHPNIGFMRQLREYESKLHHSKSPSLIWGPRRTLLSFASEEFCENEIVNTLDMPSFNLGKTDRAQIVISDNNNPAETYIITPVEILFLPPTSEKDAFRPPVRAKRITTVSESSKCIVSHFLQTSLIINNSIPDRVPPLCTCRPTLTDRTHTGLVVRKTEIAGNLSEEFSVFATPSSIISSCRPYFDTNYPLITTVQIIYELNGLIIAQKNILSRFSKSRTSVKTTGLKLSSGLSPSIKARVSLSNDNILSAALSTLPPRRLEKASILSQEALLKRQSGLRILTLNYSIKVIHIGEFSGEDLQDSPQINVPPQRQYPFYTLVTRKSIFKTPLHSAVVLPNVETGWHFTINRNRQSSKLNWAAERKHHGNEISTEFCRARPDIHYIHQTPKDLLPVPKVLAVTLAIPDSVHENPKILPRFLITRYPSRTVTNMCISPLLLSLNVRMPQILEYTNLYCVPTISKVPVPQVKFFQETRANKLLKRRIAINVTQVEIRKESEDLMDIPSIKDASKFTNLIENVKKEGDLARLQIWFEVFKRFVLAGRPIRPFVTITELLHVPVMHSHPPIYEYPIAFSDVFYPEYSEASITSEICNSILKPTLQKVLEVLYCPGDAEGEDCIEEGYEEDRNELQYNFVDITTSHNEELFHGTASILKPIVYAEVSDNMTEALDSRYLQRMPFSIITGFKTLAEQYMVQVGEESKEKESGIPKGTKKERPYIRYTPNSANENLECIAGPVDTFWYFQLDTPTAVQVKEEDEEKKRQKALLTSKNISDSRYQLFLPDPETVKRMESDKKNVSFVEPKPVPTQRIGSLVSYQRPRSQSRSSKARRSNSMEDPNTRALKDLDASYKESNLLLERRRKTEYSSSPRTSAYYSSSEASQSISSLKGLLETAQKIIGGGTSTYSSPGIGPRASRSSTKYRYYKSPRS